MKKLSIFFVAIFLASCGTAKPVVPAAETIPFRSEIEFTDLTKSETIEKMAAFEQKYVEIISALKKENHLLRVEIDYLKKRQKLIEKADRLRKAYKHIKKEIEE